MLFNSHLSIFRILETEKRLAWRRLWIIRSINPGGLPLMLQASAFERLSFVPFLLQHDGLAAPEVVRQS